MASYADDYGQSSGGYYHHQQQQQANGGPVSITQRLRNHGGLSVNTVDANQGARQQQQQQQQHYGYDPRYGYADEHAQQQHEMMEQDESGASEDEVAEQLQIHNQNQGQSHGQGQGQQRYQYEDEMQHDGEAGGVEEGGIEGQEEDLEDDSGSFSDSLSSSPSIPDEDIDFNLVYALHTFLATVDGQASVVKGDKLLLLDDSNSYWWLVRVLKTQAIGYIPAENIETPWERLARLNKHRNVDLTSATPQDVVTGPTSTTARTRFVSRIPPSQQPHPHQSQHPYSKGIPASPSHKDHPRNISPQPEPRPGSSKAKTVIFTAPTYYAHSASGLTTDDEEEGEGGEGEGMEIGEGEEYEEEEGEEGEGVEGEMQERGGFEDDEEEDEDEEDEEIDEGHQAGGEESELSDEEDDGREARGDRDTDTLRGHQLGGSLHGEFEVDEEAKREHWERERAAAMQAQQQAAEAEAQWARERELASSSSQTQLDQASPSPQSHPSVLQPAGGRTALSPQNLNVQPDPSASLSPSSSKRALSPRFEGDGISASYSPTQRSPGTSSRSAFDEFVSAPTKKLTATPPIARGEEDELDPILGTGGDEAAPYSHQVQQALQNQHLGLGVSAPTSTTGSSQPPQRVRGVDLVDPRDPRYHRMLQPTKQAGEDVLYERVVQQQQAAQAAAAAPASTASSAPSKRSFELGHHEGDASIGSVDTTGASSVLSEGSVGSTSGAGRRTSTGGKENGSSTSGPDGKKRKSGGGILGLFRKKDKKKKNGGGAGGEKEDEPRSSEDSARASPIGGGSAGGSFGSRRSGSASPASPRTSADRSSSSTATSPSTVTSTSTANKRESATAESMFSTDAALRQQELEAKQALYHQYGVQRNPGDLANTMAPRAGGGGVPSSTSMSISNSISSSINGEAPARSSTNSNRNSLQLLAHPASVISAGVNGISHGPSGSNGGLAPPQRIRPGSLIGSPSIPGLEVPLLSVMRVFAGDHVEAEATFKTVLLNQSTMAGDLVKQAMQRFRLVSADLTREEFYLTVKEVGGEERPLDDDEKPLGIFEELSERAGDDAGLPNVKRSSIGSINSISSNLSLNPAITRLGMNDWSDDSAVKFYLNRRGGPTPTPLHDGPPSVEPRSPVEAQQSTSVDLDGSSDHIATPTLGSYSPPQSQQALAPSSASAPSYRFAVRLLIHPSDLPDSVVFDPASNAIIPKAILLERQQRSGGFSDPSSVSVSPDAREKIIFFPRNANVSEVVEAALDRFGIADGVVDGGDEVEDRVSRRRSATRVKYSLATEKEGRELLLNASSKLLEAYSAPPLFKAYDRSSKEFRRRSVDATLVLGTQSDVLPSDPVFILRRSAIRAPAGVATRGPHPQRIDELEERQQQRAMGDEQEVLSSTLGPSSPTTSSSQRDLIAAQRAASRAHQRAILSAQKNSDQGVDINIPEHGTIRSARGAENDEVRYSFINQDGQEVDISEIVEKEWSSRTSPTQGRTPIGPPAAALRPTSALSRTISAAPSTDGAESFRTAQEAPGSTDDEDDQQAIDALRTTSVDVDLAGTAPYRRLRPQASSSSLSPNAAAPSSQQQASDILQNALGPRPVTSPVFNESLQERLDRVLARVKEDKARRAASPVPPGSRPRSFVGGVSGSITPSGRISPAALNGRISPHNAPSRSTSALSGRRSPLVSGGRDSPTIEQILQTSPYSNLAASPPPPRSDSAQQGHAKKPSIASISSASEQPSTPVTAGSSAAGASSSAFTPASSSNSNHPALAPQIVYRDDFGYETLVAIVEAEARAPNERRGKAERDETLEGLFGREIGEVRLEVREVFEAPRKALTDLDARLDALLLELVHV
ncbi:hypothetical protein JCM11641_005668 [Rhodosporidiobolus odoratus]